ncbi:MAG: HEAT repeat domain-containing protein [Thermoplasmata archaeon]
MVFKGEKVPTIQNWCGLYDGYPCRYLNENNIWVCKEDDGHGYCAFAREPATVTTFKLFCQSCQMDNEFVYKVEDRESFGYSRHFDNLVLICKVCHNYLNSEMDNDVLFKSCSIPCMRCGKITNQYNDGKSSWRCLACGAGNVNEKATEDIAYERMCAQLYATPRERLVEFLDDPDMRVRERVFYNYALSGGRFPVSHLSKLIEVAQFDEATKIRAEALETIVVWLGCNKQHTDVPATELIEMSTRLMVEETVFEVRNNAQKVILTLNRFGFCDFSTIIAQFNTALSHTNPAFRLNAANTLALIAEQRGKYYESSIAPLNKAALEDSDADVRRAAQIALDAIHTRREAEHPGDQKA